MSYLTTLKLQIMANINQIIPIVNIKVSLTWSIILNVIFILTALLIVELGGDKKELFYLAFFLIAFIDKEMFKKLFLDIVLIILIIECITSLFIGVSDPLGKPLVTIIMMVLLFILFYKHKSILNNFISILFFLSILMLSLLLTKPLMPKVTTYEKDEFYKVLASKEQDFRKKGFYELICEGKRKIKYTITQYTDINNIFLANSRIYKKEERKVLDSTETCTIYVPLNSKVLINQLRL